MVGEPEKRLQFRTGRPIYDSDGRLAKERIIIAEVPDFDVATLVGKEISNAAATTDDITEETR